MVVIVKSKVCPSVSCVHIPVPLYISLSIYHMYVSNALFASIYSHFICHIIFTRREPYLCKQ